MTSLRVLVVANDPLVRAGLAALLEGYSELDIIGQAAGAELASAAALYFPEVVLWDWGAEGRASIERKVPTVALVPAGTSAAEALAAGVRGLLPREADVDAIVLALQAVALGLVVLAPDMAGALERRKPAPAAVLTPRELEVLRLLADGLANKAIAKRLDVSEHTVKFHVAAILGKLNARSRTEAVGQAARLGLILL